MNYLTTVDSGGNQFVTTDGNSVPVSFTPLGANEIGWYDVKANGATGNGTTDDTADVQAAMNAARAAGKILFWTEGTYLISQPLNPPNGLAMEGTPEAAIKSAIAPTGGAGGYAKSVFYAPGAAVAGGYSGALTVAATSGSNSITTSTGTGTPVAGQWIEVSSNTSTSNVAEFAEIVQVSGAGPFTLVLDRPIQRGVMFGVGSTVVVTNPPQDLHFRGNGMVISGTGDRAFEIAGGQRCVIEGFNVTSTYGIFSAIVASFDIGSSDCVWRDMLIDQSSSAAVPANLGSGLALECAFRCTIDSCRVQNVSANSASGQAGVLLNECIDCDVLAFVTGCCNGIMCTVAGTGDVGGTQRTTIRGAYCSNLVYGALVQTQAMDFIGCDFSFNTSGGVSYSSAGSSIVNGPARFTSCRSQQNGGPAITTQSPIVVEDWAALNDLGWIAWNGSSLDVLGGSFDWTADTGAVNVVFVGGTVTGATARFTGTQFNLLSAPVHTEIAFADDSNVGANVVVLTGVRILNGTYGVAFGLGGGTGSTLRWASGTVMVGTTIPYSDAGGNFTSRGTFMSSSLGAVAVAFPDMKANDRVFITPTAAASTGYKNSQTAGTGFSWTDTAAHTYEFTVL